MASNLLTGQVIITAPGVEATFAKIQTSVKNTGTAIGKLQANVQAFGGGIRTFASGFNAVPPAVDKATSSLKRLPGTASSATQSLVNLGRVVQDAPFGFIGIANNINPLVESFQRLKAQTGSTGEAFKALAKDLGGVGGVGLAVSLLSTGLILFGDALFSTTNGINTAEVATNKFKAALKDLGKQVDDIKDRLDFSAEIQKLKFTLANGVGADANIFGLQVDTKNAGTLIKQIDQRITQLGGTILKFKPAVDGFNNAVQNVPTNFLTKGQSLLKLYGDINKIPEDALEKVSSGEKQFIIKFQAASKELEDLEKKRTEALRVIRSSDIKVQQEQKDEAKRLLDLSNQQKDEAKRLLDLSNQDYEKYVDETISQAKRYSDAFKNIVDLKLESNFFDTKSDQFKKSLDFLNDFNAGKFKIIVDPELQLSQQELQNQIDLINQQVAEIQFDVKGIRVPPIPIEPEFTIQTGFVEEKVLPLFRNLVQETAELAKPIPVPLKLNLAPEVVLQNEALDKIRKTAEGLANQINAAISEAFQGSFEGLGESLGNALSGQDFGASILEAIAGMLQSIGKALIQYGIVKEGLDKILGAGGILIPGALAIGLGILAIAASKALQNSIPGREKGGPVSPGQPYLVGEKGPELVTFKQAGTVIPHKKTVEVLKKQSQVVSKSSSIFKNTSSESIINSLKGIPARLNGGLVSSGVTYLAGERGAELYTPNTGRGIAAGTQAGGSMTTKGGLSVQVTGEFLQRGQDLLAVITLANQSKLRLQ